jgi:hypothetical protein
VLGAAQLVLESAVDASPALPYFDQLPASSMGSKFGRQDLAHIGLANPELFRDAERRNTRFKGCTHGIYLTLRQRHIEFGWLPWLGRCFRCDWWRGRVLICSNTASRLRLRGTCYRPTASLQLMPDRREQPIQL